MSIRGELTQEFHREGQRRLRDEQWFDEEAAAPPALATPVRPRSGREHLSLEAEPWQGRLGVRCALHSTETKNP